MPAVQYELQVVQKNGHDCGDRSVAQDLVLRMGLAV